MRTCCITAYHGSSSIPLEMTGDGTAKCLEGSESTLKEADHPQLEVMSGEPLVI